MKETVAVVIPAYRSSLSESDKVSLHYLKKHLAQFDTFQACPEGLTTPLKYPQVAFSPDYFRNVQTYSQLLLSALFYEQFSDYKYILIYQLDALVLKNELLAWCDKGFDYVGAPWWSSTTGFLTHPQGQAKVCGNGGLSLRNVKSHLEVIQQVERTAKNTSLSRNIALLNFAKTVLTGQSRKKWLTTPAKDYPFNEDGFWSFEAQKYVSDFRTPSFQEALRFAVETHPRESLALMKGNLPFGVHAWEKYDKSLWLEKLQT